MHIALDELEIQHNVSPSASDATNLDFWPKPNKYFNTIN
jgi:hypothetical protein